MVETQDASSEKRETQAISFAAVAGAAEHATKATQQRAATTTATEQSVAENASVASSQGDVGASSQVSDAAAAATEKKAAATAPPKVNPWKKRTEQTSKSASPDLPTAASAPNKSDGPSDGTRPAGKSAPMEDQTLWPTLDKALQQVDLASTSRRQSAPESGTTHSGEHATTKSAGKKEWVKYTPIITHTPIASQIKRGSATSSGGHARGSSHTGGGRHTGNGTVPRFSRSTSAGNKDSGSEIPADGSYHAEVAGDGQQGRLTRMTSEQSRAGDRKRAQSATNQRMPRSPEHCGQEGALDQTPERSAATSRSSSKLRGDTPVAGHEQVVGTAQQTQQHAYGADKPQRGPRDPATFNGSTGRGGRGGAAYAPRGHRGNHSMHTNGHQNGSYRHGGRTSFGSPREFVGYMGDGVPMSFVNPAQQAAYMIGPGMLGMPPMMMDPMMARPLVQQQLEYYFSIENLCKDLFLRKHMDDQGFVALPILARFNRVRSITLDYGLIRDVCAASGLIELKCVSGEQDKIRKQEGWEQWVLPVEQRDAGTHAQQQAPQQQEGVVNGAGQLSELVTAPAFVPGKQVSTSPESPQVNELTAVGRTEAASEAA
ncbi:hypothetical protein BCR37DRAFT_394648 [Protomyces lactucae-debilis]|uniref:HTH La-type RNA-binding domain-containing protein n=1 Tax=Protomyces lactucae-debilis TaxID=2754530 RepID=A0A1Y2F2M6_PROLT|nr:uncharacterized protein BCR37DRAFT_394648 [Protomyces lactucae-debilis]ORY78138.1 hypothetical protein BCR37DRAFT_394648 [Protomyces lactucae-debilis]